MYISKLSLDLRNTQVRKDLNDIHELHRTIYSALPNGDSGGPGRVLFKKQRPLNIFQQPQAIIVVSEKKPDWISLDSNYFHSPPETKDFKVYLNKTQLYRFEIRANPTKKINGKRIGLYDQKEQIQWIERKINDNGMRLMLESLEIDIEGMISSHVKTHLQLYSVVFKGLVNVAKPELVENTLYFGLGSGKGYGFGMLMLSLR